MCGKSAYRLAYVTKSGTLEPVNVCNANAKKAMAKIGLAMIAAPALESGGIRAIDRTK